jgi:hypothetical protein
VTEQPQHAIRHATQHPSAHAAGPEEHAGAHGATWSTAASATLHCLTGCTTGEVPGMVVGTALGLPAGVTVALAVALASVFGYALSARRVLAACLAPGAALKVAFAADTVSIAVMEIVDNAVVPAVPGAMDAGLGSFVFWGALAVALAVAFVVTLPVNRWLIGRGQGTRSCTGTTEHGRGPPAPPGPRPSPAGAMLWRCASASSGPWSTTSSAARTGAP